MSFTLGVYELFTYLIPGSFSLFICYELIKVFKINIGNLKLENLGLVISLALLSFILGMLISFIAHKFWKPFNKNYHPEAIALSRVIKIYPEVDFRISAGQWPIILAHLRSSALNLADYFERSKALNEMLESMAFELLLLSSIEIYQFILFPNTFVFLFVGLLCIVFAYIAFLQARKFNYWYYLNLFEYAASKNLQITDLVKAKKKQKNLDERNNT